MRVWLAGMLVLMVGCGSSWVPRAVVYAEARQTRSARLSSARTTGGGVWVGTVGLRIAWSRAARGPEEAEEPVHRLEPPPAAPCASAVLCAWERRARVRALRNLLGGSS